ncbi:MAG: hypothetical protein WEA56_15995 [Balneolaceae bacterium]
MKFFTAVLILSLLPILLPAQGISGQKSEPDQQETDDPSVVLIPVPDIYSGSVTEGPLPLVLSGAFVNPAEGGVEITYRPAYERYYGSLYISSMFRATRRIPNASRMFTAGLSIGREILLHDTKPLLPGRKGKMVWPEAEGTQFYARFGPGIGVGGIGKINGSTEFHPLIHANVAAGFLSPVGNTGGFYMEIGGKAGWLPTLDEAGFFGGPQFTIGFQLFKDRPVPMVQF